MSEAAVRQIREPGEGLLHAFANAMSDGVLLASAERVCWASERLAEMAGFESSSDLVELPLGGLFSDTGDGLPASMTRAVVECELKRVDGSVRTVVCRFAEGFAPTDDTTAWVIEDVTHLRTLERELLRLGQEIHAANREMAGLRERLRRESDEREELLTVVSHELRTPVTIISGYNRLLLAEKIGPLNDEQRSFLVESSKACRRLDLFIGNLMEASRQSADGEVLEITHARVAPVVDDVVGLLRPLFDDAKLEIRMDIADDVDRARFDRTRLEQILINLLGNAIKFSPPGAAIEIATCATSQTGKGGVERPCVEFRISDEGPGVAPAYRQRIFEPYVQVGEESGAGGLGLGLAICKRLVEAHGGEIWAEGRPESGSSFVFTIPVTDPHTETSEGGSS
jgi:signal transduction histidine kinase